VLQVVLRWSKLKKTEIQSTGTGRWPRPCGELVADRYMVPSLSPSSMHAQQANPMSFDSLSYLPVEQRHIVMPPAGKLPSSAL
jgi:hypothetical protein